MPHGGESSLYNHFIYFTHTHTHTHTLFFVRSGYSLSPTYVQDDLRDAGGKVEAGAGPSHDHPNGQHGAILYRFLDGQSVGERGSHPSFLNNAMWGRRTFSVGFAHICKELLTSEEDANGECRDRGTKKGWRE